MIPLLILIKKSPDDLFSYLKKKKNNLTIKIRSSILIGDLKSNDKKQVVNES